jgi:hypothetical protein
VYLCYVTRQRNGPRSIKTKPQTRRNALQNNGIDDSLGMHGNIQLPKRMPTIPVAFSCTSHCTHTRHDDLSCPPRRGCVGYQPLCMYVPREKIILDSGERVPISGPAAIPTARFVQSFAGGGGLFCYLWCSNSEETLDKKTVTTVMHGSVRLCRLLRWF